MWFSWNLLLARKLECCSLGISWDDQAPQNIYTYVAVMMHTDIFSPRHHHDHVEVEDDVFLHFLVPFWTQLHIYFFAFGGIKILFVCHFGKRRRSFWSKQEEEEKKKHNPNVLFVLWNVKRCYIENKLTYIRVQFLLELIFFMQ